MFLDGSALGILLRKAGADDDEAFAALFLGQDINSLGAELGSDAKDCTVDLRQVLYFCIAFYALNFSLFGVNGIDLSLEGALEEVFQRLAAGFMYITGSTAYNDTAWIQ